MFRTAFIKRRSPRRDAGRLRHNRLLEFNWSGWTSEHVGVFPLLQASETAASATEARGQVKPAGWRRSRWPEKLVDGAPALRSRARRTKKQLIGHELEGPRRGREARRHDLAVMMGRHRVARRRGDRRPGLPLGGGEVLPDQMRRVEIRTGQRRLRPRWRRPRQESDHASNFPQVSGRPERVARAHQCRLESCQRSLHEAASEATS
jgi:hypothetical protein